MTWLRKKTIPAFAPRGDEVIGLTQNGQGVTISQEFWRWLSLLATRLQTNVDAPGTIQMTAAAVEPEGWLFLNGQTVDERLYPELSAIFGATSGVITLPDYASRLPMGAGSIVALNGTAGAEMVTLTRREMPKHNHGVKDRGHAHKSEDKGHLHGLQLDSHGHKATEVEGEEHIHDINDTLHNHDVNDPLHNHSGSVGQVAATAAAGTDVPTPQNSTVTTSATGVTVQPAYTGITETDVSRNALRLEVTDAEVTGTVLKSKADIRVHKAKTGIETLDDGEGQPFSIIPPVFGVNWMVKT